MRRLKKNKSGMLILDLTTTFTIIGFLVWIFGGIIGRLALNVRQTSLRYQLSNFRLLIVLFKEFKGDYPKSLAALIQSRHKLSQAQEIIFKEKFLGKLALDQQGEPLDVFGNSFYYNYKGGVIGSQTKGYENW